MAKGREIPVLLEFPRARKAPFELGFERNTMYYFHLGLGGEREFQVEEMTRSEAWKVSRDEPVGRIAGILLEQGKDVGGMPAKDSIHGDDGEVVTNI